MRALRAVSTEKGRDPADFVARRLRRLGPGPRRRARGRARRRARRSCPRSPASSPRRGCCSRAPSTTTSASAASARASPTSTRSRRLDAEMREHLAPRIGDGEPEWRRVADVRYRGQSWSVPIELPGELDAAAIAGARRALRGRARAAVRHAPRPRARRSTSARCACRARARARAVRAAGRASASAERTRAAPTSGRRTARSTRPSSRARSLGAEPVAGPLLVDEYDTTVVVPPGWTVRLDAGDHALVLELVAVDERRAAAAHADAIAMRLVANALETAADEMATTIFRTAHSAVVRDAMDYSAALCAPSGETVAQAVTIPLQLGSIPNAMRTLLERFGDALPARATSTSSTTRSTARATRPTSSSRSRPSSARR